MSAVVIPFRGAWEGHQEPAADKGPTEARALHDARAIIAARNADSWSAKLLLALLETLSARQLWQLEFRLLGPDLARDAGNVQALALVQLSTGTKEHRDLVRSWIDRLSSLEAGR